MGTHFFKWVICPNGFLAVLTVFSTSTNKNKSTVVGYPKFEVDWQPPPPPRTHTHTLGENGSVDSTDTLLKGEIFNSKLQNLIIFLEIAKSCNSKTVILFLKLGDFWRFWGNLRGF